MVDINPGDMRLHIKGEIYKALKKGISEHKKKYMKEHGCLPKRLKIEVRYRKLNGDIDFVV